MENYKVISRSKDNGSTKTLLKNGMVPGIIYGKNTNPTKIAFEDKILQKIMNSGGFYSKIIDLDINGTIENFHCYSNQNMVFFEKENKISRWLIYKSNE